MKNIKLILIFLLAFSVALSVNAENVSKIIYDSYINKDMTRWKAVIDSLQLEKESGKLSIEQKWELLDYQYGYIAWAISKKKTMKHEAETYLDVAKDNLSELVEISGKTSLSNAFSAAFVAYEIGITPFKAPFIGLKCMKYGETALKQDSLNHFALIQYGNIMNYMPVAFGGSKDKAIVHYKKAKEIMRQDELLYKDNWLYMNLILTIADIYKNKKDYDTTKQYYLEALELEPGYKFVEELMGNLIRN
jgi:tetratricopeptide (TPR) repeat protein